MADRRIRQQLQALLAVELIRMLRADGWSLDPSWDCGPESTDIAAFRRHAASDVSATVLFSRPSTWPAESSLPDGIAMAGVHDVPQAARLLPDTVPAQATALARRHASVEALLTANRGDPDRLGREIEVVLALLAAAGRGRRRGRR